MAYIIGITGSIATGKSTVANYLKQLGYLVIDSDEVSHRALVDSEYCIQEVKKHFPSSYRSGMIDRKIVASIIFKDKEKREILNQIIHPYVINQLENVKKRYQKQEQLIFFDIPLLYEVKLEYLCDEIWVVYTNQDIQLERLMKRNNISKEEALLRINSQMSIEIKKELADKIVDNQKDIATLYQQIKQYIMEVNDGINGK